MEAVPINWSMFYNTFKYLQFLTLRKSFTHENCRDLSWIFGLTFFYMFIFSVSSETHFWMLLRLYQSQFFISQLAFNLTLIRHIVVVRLCDLWTAEIHFLVSGIEVKNIISMTGFWWGSRMYAKTSCEF